MYTEEEVRKATLEYFDGDELAANVFVTKYALKDKQGEYLEKTPDDMHKRLAKEFASVEEQWPEPLSYGEIYDHLSYFDRIVPQGSPMFGMGNSYVNASLSNCVVVASPDDNISSICDSGKELANLFKRRCGVGIDISQLRPEHTPVNNAAGTTTGAWSFADFYSYVCRMIGQNGRRGALMISLDCRHPDVEQFITMKYELEKVTGANVSVRLYDDFMEAVENDEEYVLHWPCGSDDPKYTLKVRASDVWSKLVKSARDTADPGLMMWSNITKRLPAECYPQFKTITTNPCGEIPLSAYDSCRLISINLRDFITNPFEKSAKFDYKEFERIVRVGMRLSDDLVELELKQLEKIGKICDTKDEENMWRRLHAAAKHGRRTGLGTHGLADTLARLGLRYDSDKALKAIDKIYETLKISAYSESVELAKQRGPFPNFDWELEKENEFIKDLPEWLQEDNKKYGRRNISILTNAPTGSVSILSQSSSGIEPVFRNSYTRRRKLSHNEAHIDADFIDDMGDRWLEYKVFHHNLKKYFELKDTNVVPKFFTESDAIDWHKRIDVQAAIQKHIDHSISSTINLPEDTDVDTVAELYISGWKKGLKGITVYREGSKSGVLISDEKKEDSSFPQHHAPRRPTELRCDIHQMNVRGDKWTVFVGLINDKPYELIGGLADKIELPSQYEVGVVTKRSFKTRNNAYDLTIGDNGSEFKIKDVISLFDNPNHSALTRLVSLSLRHGAKVNYVVEQLQKEKGADMFTFAKCLSRVLKKYIVDGEKVSSHYCEECNTKSLVYVDGCSQCTQCGSSKCN